MMAADQQYADALAELRQAKARIAELEKREQALAAKLQVPNDVWESLQRLIENAQTLGPASQHDALLVAKHRDRQLFLYGTASLAQRDAHSDCELECGAYGTYCKCAAEAQQWPTSLAQ